MKPGDIVTNGHIHPNKELMRARVIAVEDTEAWVFAQTGPHKGGRLTFPIIALDVLESEK